MNRFTEFYRISPPAPAREMDADARSKYYRCLRLQALAAATLGYSLYYVCRTSLNVMKKPILDSGALDASQLGVIGSALLFAYAVGKFVNGFIADYCNIKRFMATGLILSYGFVRFRRWFLVRQGFYGRQSFGFRGVMEPAEDDHHSDCSRHGRSEESCLPSCECHDGAHE